MPNYFKFISKAIKLKQSSSTISIYSSIIASLIDFFSFISVEQGNKGLVWMGCSRILPIG